MSHIQGEGERIRFTVMMRCKGNLFRLAIALFFFGGGGGGCKILVGTMFSVNTWVFLRYMYKMP